jgi:hypothetical protein
LVSSWLACLLLVSGNGLPAYACCWLLLPCCVDCRGPAAPAAAGGQGLNGSHLEQ